MKKIFLTIGIVCFGFGAFAQETATPTTEVVQTVPLTHRGFKILPEKGDFAIGIDAAPFFKYLGNMFTDNGSNEAPSFSDQEWGIRGKYFLQDNRAIRATLNFQMSTEEYKQTVRNDFEYYNAPDLYNGQTVVDHRESGITKWDVSVGYEFRRGYRRLQGFYGAEVGFNYLNTKDVYTYGNPITATNQNPTTYDFNGNVLADGRTLETNGGLRLGFTVGAFAGIEYFIASKLSIGGELGLGLDFFTTSQDESTNEKFDVNSNSVKEFSTRSFEASKGPQNGFGVGTLAKGSLFVTFHF